MMVKQLCQKFLDTALNFMHAKRRNALMDVCWSLMNNGRLCLADLGYNMEGDSKVKNKIKKADRLLGNKILHREIPDIYKEIANIALSLTPVAYIAVDWSGCCSNKNFLLRASLMYDGRSIPLYNEMFFKCNDTVAEHKFLNNLKKIIPCSKKVVIITDAGFKTAWFKKVQSLNWDYIGRADSMTIKLPKNDTWIHVKDLNNIEPGKVKYLGQGTLTKKIKIATNVYVYKGKLKSRKGQSRYPGVNKQFSKLYRRSWVLVTSLPGGIKIKGHIKKIYEKRMQIEQNFRDDKNTRYGFAWRNSRTKSVPRISVLCLIAMIATFLLLLIGTTAEKLKLHYHFQANTVKSHRVLSLVFLGKQILRNKPKIRYSSIKKAMLFIREILYKEYFAGIS